jgi:rhodanese-related sulfurtransferase
MHIRLRGKTVEKTPKDSCRILVSTHVHPSCAHQRRLLLVQSISKEELKKKVDSNRDDFHLIEVLGAKSFQEYHLPQAENIPLKDQEFQKKIHQAVPNRDDEVVVYCKDKDCTASPEAAEKLNQMGYSHVFDYEGGKEEWKAAGLPVEEGRA